MALVVRISQPYIARLIKLSKEQQASWDGKREQLAAKGRYKGWEARFVGNMGHYAAAALYGVADKFSWESQAGGDGGTHDIVLPNVGLVQVKCSDYPYGNITIRADKDGWRKSNVILATRVIKPAGKGLVEIVGWIPTAEAMRLATLRDFGTISDGYMLKREQMLTVGAFAPWGVPDGSDGVSVVQDDDAPYREEPVPLDRPMDGIGGSGLADIVGTAKDVALDIIGKVGRKQKPRPGPSRPWIAATWASRALVSYGLRVHRLAPMPNDAGSVDYAPAVLYAEGSRLSIVHQPTLGFESPTDYRWPTVAFALGGEGDVRSDVLKSRAVVVVSGGFYGYAVIPFEVIVKRATLTSRKTLSGDGFEPVYEVPTSECKTLSWLAGWLGEQGRSDAQIAKAIRTIEGSEWQERWLPVDGWTETAPLIKTRVRNKWDPNEAPSVETYLAPEDVRHRDVCCNKCGAPKPPGAPALCYVCHVESRRYSAEQAKKVGVGKPRVGPIARRTGGYREDDVSLLDLIDLSMGIKRTNKRPDGRYKDVAYDDEVDEDR